MHADAPFLRFRVQGMHCANCARQVQEAFECLDGVGHVETLLEQREVRIHGSSAVLPEKQACLHVFETAGFTAVILGSQLSEKNARVGLFNQSVWFRHVCLSGPVFLTMVLMEWGFRWGNTSHYRWLSFFMAGVTLWVTGSQFFLGAWNQLKQKRLGMDALVSLGSCAAFGLSLWGLFTDQLAHLYFMETVGVLAIISLGHWLEERMQHRLTKGWERLHQWLPKEACWLNSENIGAQIPMAQVEKGDRLLLRPGDTSPVDGRVLEGESQVDESMLTGESRPVFKTSGDPVYAGTHNQGGRLIICATATGQGTALADIVRLIQRAEGHRARIQRLVDHITAIFVPVVVFLAILTFVAWSWAPGKMLIFVRGLEPFLWPPLLFESPLTAAMVHAVSVLMVACPCAMGLATPVAIMAGVRAAASRGILIQGGMALEKVGALDTVVFDKTGTLTQGKPQVMDQLTVSGKPSDTDNQRLRSVLHAMAAESRHPLSQALAAGITFPEADATKLSYLKEIAGAGLEAARSPTPQATDIYRLGSLRWLETMSVECSDAARAFMEYWECRGASLVGFSQGPELRLLIALQDALKPQALEVVQWLLSHGYQVELMSGDGERASHHVASELGLKPEQVKACLSPEDKLRAIQALQAKGLSVAFVGDGMNDAPVLQQADLGISVSQASDLARAASDMTLVRVDIASIPEAMQLSSATLRTIHQNLFWAFFYNAVAVPVAMMGFLHPLVCALAMGMSDLLVVGNALRLNARWRQSRASLKSGASEP